jgi:hypothetical protein
MAAESKNADFAELFNGEIISKDRVAICQVAANDHQGPSCSHPSRIRAAA